MLANRRAACTGPDCGTKMDAAAPLPYTATTLFNDERGL
jgi:hypothetical protein